MSTITKHVCDQCGKIVDSRSYHPPIGWFTIIYDLMMTITNEEKEVCSPDCGIDLLSTLKGTDYDE